MGLTNFILTCEKDNEELKKDINYYKNMASRLKKENQELKKQVEELDKKIFFIKNELDMRQKSINNKLIQQKEFIKYLGGEIERLPGLTTWFYKNAKGKLIGHTEIVQGAYKEILQKYKEILGDDK